MTIGKMHFEAFDWKTGDLLGCVWGETREQAFERAWLVFPTHHVALVD